jgi:hypothetical protein
LYFFLLLFIITSVTKAVLFLFCSASADNCISLLVTQLGSEALACADTLLPFLTTQAFYNRLCSKTFLVSFFSLVQRVRDYIIVLCLGS